MYRLTLRTASGRERTLTVSATTGQSACNRALRRANTDEPGNGWMVVPSSLARV